MFKILRVKTGETVIGSAIEETQSGIRLSHPMEIRTQVLFDKMGTIKKEMTILVVFCSLRIQRFVFPKA